MATMTLTKAHEELRGTGEEFIAFFPSPITVFRMLTNHNMNALFHVGGDYAEDESGLIAGHIA
jgi:hypothetical protein